MASRSVDRNAFFVDLRNSGQRIVASFGAGGIRALEAGFAFKETLWPYRQYCAADFVSSGGGLGVSCCDVGYSPEGIREEFSHKSLHDIVDVQKKGAIILGNIRRWKSSGLGINSGDKLRKTLLRAILKQFEGTVLPVGPQGDRDMFANIPSSPPLFVLATRRDIDHEGRAFIFSREHTPEVSISRAVMASCADMLHFQHQKIQLYRNGRLETLEFSDAGGVEPLPLVSVLKDHVVRGLDPKDLTIIGIIPTYDFTPVPLEASIFRHFIHAAKESFRNLIINQIRYVSACGTRVIVLEPNMNFLSPFIPAPRNIIERAYQELNIGHFGVCYPWMKEVVENLFDMAVDAYFRSPEKKIINAQMDQLGGAMAEATDEI